MKKYFLGALALSAMLLVQGCGTMAFVKNQVEDDGVTRTRSVYITCLGCGGTWWEVFREEESRDNPRTVRHEVQVQRLKGY